MKDFVQFVDLIVDVTFGRNIAEYKIGKSTEKLNGRLPKLVKGSVC